MLTAAQTNAAVGTGLWLLDPDSSGNESVGFTRGHERGQRMGKALPHTSDHAFMLDIVSNKLSAEALAQLRDESKRLPPRGIEYLINVATARARWSLGKVTEYEQRVCGGVGFCKVPDEFIRV